MSGYVRVNAASFGTQQGRQDNRRRDQPDDAGRRLAELPDVQQRRADVAEGGPEPGQKALARLGHGDGPRRPRQQAEPEPLFERLHRVTDRRAADAEPDRRLGEAPFLGDHGEDREHAQILAQHW